MPERLAPVNRGELSGVAPGCGLRQDFCCMRQAAFGFVAWVTVVASTLGCDTSDPTRVRAKLDERMAPARTLEQTFQRIHAQLRALEPSPCSDLTIRSAIAQSQSG